VIINNNYLTIVLFSFLPISIFLGNFILNSFIFIISLICLYKIFTKKIIIEKYNITLSLLIFFLFSLLVNLIYSNNFDLSYLRVVKFFFVIFFIIFLIDLVSNEKKNFIQYQTFGL
jgi:hypothetical protein